MAGIVRFLTRRRGGNGWHWTDIVTWVWLIGGLVTDVRPRRLAGRFLLQDTGRARRVPALPPALCDTGSDGRRVTTSRCPSIPSPCPTGQTEKLAEVRRIGLVAQMVDPANPGEIVKVNIANRRPVETVSFAICQLHRALHPLRLPALPVEFGVRDDHGDADHAARQLHGGLRALEIPVPRPRRRHAC